MKKPNFFIIGAPKCGTTSLAKWLSQHPQVFMPAVKEPLFFDTDQPVGIKNLRDYEHLFLNANDSQIAIGEASARYLHSRVAVQNIIEYAPGSKFIVMLRNPVEMAPSLHEQRVYSLNEDVTDFEAAWLLQEVRAQGENIPEHCDDSSMLQYEAYCKLGKQMERLLSIVSRAQVHFIFLDDLRARPQEVFQDVLNFLGLNAIRRNSFAPENVAKDYRSYHIAILIKKLLSLKQSIGLGGRSFGLANGIAKLNRRERPRAPISATMREKLQDAFASDIQLLERLTKRDLKHWLD